MEYDLNAIVTPYVTSYIREKTEQKDALLRSLEIYAEENNVPIVEPETARLLSVLTKLKRPARILEVGCAIGYSAILMSKGLAEGGNILTLEYDPKMVRAARENVKKAGLCDVINVVEADAKDYLSYIDEDEIFDIIFLDGPKAHYLYMLDDAVRLLKKGGLLISDNILFKGMTADDDHFARRKVTIIHRLREYIDTLMKHPQLETSILSQGDGITLSIKIMSDYERFGY
ncbi:MAG: O-methyltransferase [Oscillospiraceae bacterium]|nr:O-methyltransferase [Oscillospiraceae bacterium]